ncbi:MAG: molybdate ABC transporter permease subunit [Chloroflexota bacterium]
MAGVKAPRKPISWPGGRLVEGLPLGLGLLVLLYFALPVVAILWFGLSFETLGALGEPPVLAALGLTAFTTLIVVVAALAAGTPLAYLLARREFRGKAVVEALVELPVALPPVVAGVALLMVFGRRGLFGPLLEQLGLILSFSTAAVVMAQFFVGAPFYIRAAALGFRTVPREVEEAAAVDGATPWQTFCHVTFPIALPGILSGLLLCGTRAAAEFGATLMFAGNFPGRTQTLTLAVYTAMESSLSRALALSVLLVLMALGVVVGARLLLGREQVSA